ncbi:hypothetical protein ACHHYP_17074 [Achlya hypogyna]|uniref:Uncharacterized protein n=1 Tax=Achlya hypogyna TaxID=1202772 RepID=A0A1V9Y5A9_ACHHY|nr:hypothetical protein ACHHYP_17074 [Achlya hypogyna]
MDTASELALEKAKNQSLQEEVERLRKAVVNVTLLAEKEEEWMMNQFIRRMQPAKSIDKKQALELEAEMKRLRHEKVELGMRYEQEQEAVVNRLCRQLQVKEATILALVNDDPARQQALADRSRDVVSQLQRILATVLKEKRALEKQLAEVLDRRSADSTPVSSNEHDKIATLRQLLTQSQQASTAMLEQLRHMEQQPQAGHKRPRRSPLLGPLPARTWVQPSPTSAC